MIIMADVHDIETRSFNMSMIKGKNTKPELLVRKFLFKNGYRYRLNYAKLPGRPDIVLLKHQTVIFVNGCFWHGHEGCKQFKFPKTNNEFWSEKILKTKEKDKIVNKMLIEKGFKVITIWECQLVKDKRSVTFSELLQKISN